MYILINKILYGGDYNPDQWLDDKDIIDKDFELMKEANINVVSLGIFSWSTYEKVEGDFTFEWLDEIITRLTKENIYFFLATPSGARPAWMAKKYPEVLRTNKKREKELFGERHNHCFTSPLYRKKVKIINGLLAKRYGNEKNLLGWHISNEYNGECHCDLCQDAFRSFLKDKYKTLDELNKKWYTAFWNSTFTNWEEIQSPSPIGSFSLHGLNLDWKRFVTWQTRDFMLAEIDSIREFEDKKPVTTNFMGTFEHLDYWRLKDGLDIVSWDAYPQWHMEESDIDVGVKASFDHSLTRSLLKKPFLLMESCPSSTNWQDISRLKRPGLLELASIQSIAHGSQSVMFFQIRKSRGASEKFHGAVIDHVNHGNTRVFREIRKLGERLKTFEPLLSTINKPRVAIVFDWENRWAINDSQGPRNIGVKYLEEVVKHYKIMWTNGIDVDIVSEDSDLSDYDLLIAPMTYMLREKFTKGVEAFVAKGGTLVSSYWSGIADETDLCFMGGYPGPLREILGIWSEEIDGLRDGEKKKFSYKSKEYEAIEFCDLIHLEGAESLGVYKEDFYKDYVSVSKNTYKKGSAYYLGCRSDEVFLGDFYRDILDELNIKNPLGIDIPYGVTMTKRQDEKNEYIFLMNFNNHKVEIDNITKEFIDIEDKKDIKNKVCLDNFQIKVLKRK